MDKIKEFIANLLQNKKLLWIIGGVVAFLIIAGIVIGILAGGNNQSNVSGGGNNTPAEMLSNCSVSLRSEGGLPLKGVGIYIYEDSTKTELVYYERTNDDGIAVITVDVPAGSLIYLDGVPGGYKFEESYTVITAKTEIVLATTLLQEMAPISLGNVMFDFTVTTPEGKNYTLSELLQNKKAVMLNLWYTGCEPCKLEFPYLQKAYMQYSSDIEVLAINPMESDDDAAISDFAAQNGLTFPMAKCDPAWATLIKGFAYPTSVIIDRFGTVALIHTGKIEDAKTFEDTFAFFAAEDYVQATVEDISELITEEPPVVEGTLENPLEFGGMTEFTVTVEPGQTIYCNIYKASGMDLLVESTDLKINYNTTEYEPVDGVITFPIEESSPDTPALVMFTNTGEKAKAYKVNLAFPIGTVNNPLPLELGEFTADLVADNALGLYYACVAQQDGNFAITVLKATKKVEYAIALNNLTSSTYLTLEENGIADENGNMTLALPVVTGDDVQLIVTVLPNSKDEYPAASIKMNAEILVVEEPTEETTIPETTLPEGTIPGTTIPDDTNPGATTDPTTDPTTKPTTKPTTDPTTKPTTDPTTDPTTKPTTDPTTDPTTKPTTDPTTKPTTDPTTEPTTKPTTDPTTEPTTKPTTDPTTEPTTKPTTDPTTEPTTKPTTEATTAPAEPNYDGTLINSTENPEFGNMEGFETISIEPGEKVLYAVRGNEKAKLEIEDDDAYVVYNNNLYKPKSGTVSFTIRTVDTNSPAMIEIGNSGTEAKTFQVKFIFDKGTQGNPYTFETGKTIEKTISKGNEKGIFYTYTAKTAGTLTLTLLSDISVCDIIITNKNVSDGTEQVSLSVTREVTPDATSVSMDLNANEKVEINFVAIPDENFNYPKVTFEVSGTFS